MKKKGFAILLGICLFCAGPAKTEAASQMNFKEGETRLIYRSGSYIAVAGKCKVEDSVPFLTDSANENEIKEVKYGHLADDWILVTSNEFPEEVADNDINIDVRISGSDNLYPVDKLITKDEAKAIGLQIIDDHICDVGADKKAYTEDGGFYQMYGFDFLDEYYGERHEEIVDRLSFYAEDGTELEDCFEGYSMSVDCPDYDLPSTIVLLKFHNEAEQNNAEQKEKNKEQNKQMCDKLKELNPYIVYTAPDGSTTVLKFED